MLNIGPRIKYFRQRAGLSQMELEMMIESAFGSVSRFEAGKVTPTRETVEYICQALKLNEIEINYLIGACAYPASPAEIEEAIMEVSNILKKKGFLGYLLDERWRLHAYSDTFARFLNITKEEEQQLRHVFTNSTFIELLLLPELKVRGSLDFDSSDHNLKNVLKWYYQETAFMTDDPYFQRSLKVIQNDPLASKIWVELEKESSATSVPTSEEREINFKVKGLNVSLRFYNQSLHKNPRFKLVEFVPNNLVLRLLTNLK